MSIFDSLKTVAGGLFGTVGSHELLDTNELADSLLQHVHSLDESTLLTLGEQLLETFTKHDAYPSDGSQAAQDAGTTAEAVASGSPDALAALITFAKSHPQVLQAAVSAFAKHNVP